MNATLDPRIDTAARGVPLYRLVDVELRKLIDTRAGLWLLVLIGAFIVGAGALMGLMAVGFEEIFPWSMLLTGTAWLPGIFLSILGILTVTSEWGQRTSLVTFALEPRRLRVVFAKLCAGLLATLILVLFTIVFTAGINQLQATILGQEAVWDIQRAGIVAFGVSQMAFFVLGFSFGMLIPNTPAAIVMYFFFRFLVPSMFDVGTLIWEWVGPVVEWIDFQNALQVFLADMSSRDNLWHLMSSAGLWVVLPLVLGSLLLVRREIK